MNVAIYKLSTKLFFAELSRLSWIAISRSLHWSQKALLDLWILQLEHFGAQHYPAHTDKCSVSYARNLSLKMDPFSERLRQALGKERLDPYLLRNGSLSFWVRFENKSGWERYRMNPAGNVTEWIRLGTLQNESGWKR